MGLGSAATVEPPARLLHCLPSSDPELRCLANSSIRSPPQSSSTPNHRRADRLHCHTQVSAIAMSTRHPEILWAQRSDKIFLTVELPDAKNAQVKLEPDGRFMFTATSKEAKYETELQLYGAVKVKSSKINEGRRHTFCVIEKEEKGWWERLLKKEGKAPPFVKADWNHWIDEDEEDETVKNADFDMTRAMNDYGGQLEEHAPDSDDEEDFDDAPDLSKAEA
ncbi:hypothetical protein M758_4G064700 [Ceratodon purpureus]|nr:hypothetical protein M758_4G064700 [Ceratodon purpureus]